MKVNFFAAAALALLMSSVQLSAEISFRQCRRGPETEGPQRAFSSKYDLVCITDPGVSATINGQSVHVYKTGAFGMPLVLSKGENTVKVVLKKGSETRTENLVIVYDEAGRPRRQETKPEDPDAPKPDTFYERLTYVETLEDAYLQYGTGSDRLGASRMGCLDAGITLKVVGQYNDLYKVRLCESRWAYIPTSCVKPTAKETRVVNTNNMSISNEGKRDRVTISFPNRLPYYVWAQTDPTVINVDIYGAMNNSNWITHRTGLGMIDYVDFEQVESDLFRIVIKLKEKYSWGYAVKYVGNMLQIEVKHSPVLSVKGMKIGLDAGHGGPSSLGAVGFTGLKEAEVNLDIVRRIKKMLEKKGATIVLSRSEDVEVSMAERRRIFSEADVDLMVSIHNNAGGGPFKPMGTSTYYKYITNRALASCLLDRMLELDVPNFGLTGNFNFGLGTPTEYPNALVEGLFMSSLPDEEILASEKGRQEIAEKVVAGIEDYLKKVAEK